MPAAQKRPLNAGAPEVLFFQTEDNVTLRLTRFQGGSKGPVMLVHGLGVGSNIFSTDTIATNLLEFLYQHGYDVWLLDFRVSILLEASRQQCDGDQIARYDFPAAIDRIRQATGAGDVQCVVHCYGATTFSCPCWPVCRVCAPSCARRLPPTSSCPGNRRQDRAAHPIGAGQARREVPHRLYPGQRRLARKTL